MKEFKRQTRLMGSSFEFIIVDDEERGEDTIDECIAEVKRIEYLLTEFSSTSQTSAINAAAGQYSVSVDKEVFDLITRCQKISLLTQGAFDITAAALKKIYSFKGETISLPDRDSIERVLHHVGFEKIKLSAPSEVFLTTPGMHINFAAIGKGYAADQLKSMMRERGVESGVINASGDLTAWGARADGSPWKVGIADPTYPSRMVMWLPVQNTSVATSGNYEQFFMHNGTRYAHNLDPKTGLPVTGIKSVTIISPSAELSDALATAVFVMGVDVGMNLIEQLPQLHAVVVDDNNRIFTSSHLKINQQHEG